jgi:transposase
MFYVGIDMEAIRHYWVSLYSHLLDLGYTAYVINPIQFNTFRKMYIRQIKNDSKNSFIITQIMRFGEFSTTSLADKDIMALRQLSHFSV